MCARFGCKCMHMTVTACRCSSTRMRVYVVWSVHRQQHIFVLSGVFTGNNIFLCCLECSRATVNYILIKYNSLMTFIRSAYPNVDNNYTNSTVYTYIQIVPYTHIYTLTYYCAPVLMDRCIVLRTPPSVRVAESFPSISSRT